MYSQLFKNKAKFSTNYHKSTIEKKKSVCFRAESGEYEVIMTTTWPWACIATQEKT